MPPLPAIRERVMTWAMRSREAAFLEGIRAFLDPALPAQQQLPAAGAFAVLTPPAQGPSLIEAYAEAVGTTSRAERLVFEGWKNTWFSTVRVTGVVRGVSIDLHDVVRDVRFTIQERSGSQTVEIGAWMAASYLDLDGRTQFEGTVVQLGSTAPIHAVQAALRSLEAQGVTPATATPAHTRRAARPMVKAIRMASAPPRLVNCDDHDIVMVTSTLDIPWRRLREALKTWPDADFGSGYVSLIREGLAETAPVSWATLRLTDGVVTLETNSRERHDAFFAWWDQHHKRPIPVLDSSEEGVPSNPHGLPIRVDVHTLRTPPGVSKDDMVARHTAHYRSTWADEPILGLDGLTPRQAVAAGRRAEVWALAADEELARTAGLT